MRQCWFISDTHFGHGNILRYMPEERPFASPELLDALNRNKQFKPNSDLGTELDETLETHNQYIVDILNTYVRKNDTLWILGDVCYGRKEHLSNVKKIICENKNLVLGNHDLQPVANYVSVGFNKIYGMARHKEFVLTHAPIHPSQLDKRYNANIHGHLHTYDVDDPRYINVNIDRLEGMKPLTLPQIREIINDRQNSPYRTRLEDAYIS